MTVSKHAHFNNKENDKGEMYNLDFKNPKLFIIYIVSFSLTWEFKGTSQKLKNGLNLR